MNTKLIIFSLTAGALAGFSNIALAHEDEDDPRAAYQQHDRGYERQGRFEFGGDRLGNEVDHLNRMLVHVQREMRRRGADRHMWSEYQHLRSEAQQLDWQFRRGEQFYNRRRLRAQIAHMHAELHHLEEELHVPQGGWYQWR